MAVVTVEQFQRLLRAAAGLEGDPADLDRCSAVVTGTVYRMLRAGQARAAAERRYLIEPADLPLSAGLKRGIAEFQAMHVVLDRQRIFDELGRYRPLDRVVASETAARLPQVVGGLIVTLARTFGIVFPGLTHPLAEEWDTVAALVELYQ